MSGNLVFAVHVSNFCAGHGLVSLMRNGRDGRVLGCEEMHVSECLRTSSASRFDQGREQAAGREGGVGERRDGICEAGTLGVGSAKTQPRSIPACADKTSPTGLCEIVQVQRAAGDEEHVSHLSRCSECTKRDGSG